MSRTPGPASGGHSANMGGPGLMVAPDIRSLFPQGPSPGGLPPLASSPPRWPEQHSRQLTSVPGSSAGLNSTMTSSGPTFAGSQQSGGNQVNSQSPYNRLTSLPIDPWGSPGKQQQQHQSSTSGYPSSVGQFRTPPPGMSNTTSGGMHGASPSGFFSPNNQSQQSQIFAPEGPYGGTLVYQTPSTPSSHLYSNSNSPVQGSSSNGFSGFMGHPSPNQQQQQLHHHQPSPQRPLSGSSSGSRDGLQFLEDKMMSGPAFGPGYGPSLNSGSARNHQQQMVYQQQHPPNQTYPSQANSGLSNQYPQQRQRHSSHNSSTSHHTMFLGTGLGSTGGSVNSDDVSTEDEGDEPFDDMRNKYRSFNSQYQQQYPGTNSGFNSLGGPPTVSNRRGSVPSMGSMYSNQQLYHQNGSAQQTATPPPNVIRLSNSSSDLYARKSLVSAMARHTIGQQDNSIGSGRSPIGASLNLSGSAFSNDRDIFSSGLGGIIGGGTISHGNTPSNNTFSGLGNSMDNQSNGRSGGSSSLMGSTLSPSALPFLAESPLDRGWGR